MSSLLHAMLVSLLILAAFSASAAQAPEQIELSSQEQQQQQEEPHRGLLLGSIKNNAGFNLNVNLKLPTTKTLTALAQFELTFAETNVRIRQPTLQQRTSLVQALQFYYRQLLGVSADSSKKFSLEPSGFQFVQRKDNQPTRFLVNATASLTVPLDDTSLANGDAWAALLATQTDYIDVIDNVVRPVAGGVAFGKVVKLRLTANGILYDTNSAGLTPMGFHNQQSKPQVVLDYDMGSNEAPGLPQTLSSQQHAGEDGQQQTPARPSIRDQLKAEAAGFSP